jgi:hypothetical protein
LPIAGNVANWQQSSDKFGLKKENGKPHKTSISGAAKTRKELGKTGKKQETENIRFPKIRARKTRNNRERIKAKAEKRQRQNKERTKKK